MNTTQQNLIKFYEDRLAKVKAMWSSDSLRGQDYIDYAEKQLEEVKNGRNW